MNTTGNTILITGGSAGIGLEMARLFSNEGNTVIITGRTKERLDETVKKYPQLIPFRGDVNNFDDVERLKGLVTNDYPGLNIVINNAGNASIYDVSEAAYQNAKGEIETNYLSIINLNDRLLPLLRQQPSSAIVNVTSITAFMPSVTLPTYAASKAALHFYTDALRRKLKENNSNVAVFELMPPLVNTAFSRDIGGEKNGIAPQKVAQSLFEALQNDQYEVPVGATIAVHQKINEVLQNFH